VIFLVVVEAHPDEPERTTDDQLEAGRQWLADREAEGVITEHPRAFRKTGGFMLMRAESREALLKLLSENYPLYATTDYHIWEDVIDLDEGFDIFRGWREDVKAGRR
jgi:hypothetical protein